MDLKANKFNEKIKTIKDSFFSALDDFQKYYVFFNKNPEVDEYQNFFANSKGQLQGLNSDMFLVTNNIQSKIKDLDAEMQVTSNKLKAEKDLNGELLNSYWADGLIIATPTGSTGYNMSCNGPILFPDSSNFVITPVAPHNLNVRSVVVPDSSVISFEVEGRTEELICALDARKEIVPIGIQIAVKKEAFCVHFIRLNENSYLTTLRTKLTWGLDKRN